MVCHVHLDVCIAGRRRFQTRSTQVRLSTRVTPNLRMLNGYQGYFNPIPALDRHLDFLLNSQTMSLFSTAWKFWAIRTSR